MKKTLKYDNLMQFYMPKCYELFQNHQIRSIITTTLMLLLWSAATIWGAQNHYISLVYIGLLVLTLIILQISYPELYKILFRSSQSLFSAKYDRTMILNFLLVSAVIAVFFGIHSREISILITGITIFIVWSRLISTGPDRFRSPNIDLVQSFTNQ
eukprot:NODE_36_length_36011_cov_1.012920.p21 type:complete len:156 gc:universal NODE_36_length_36011_cov_1.012920:11852-12319(+)